MTESTPPSSRATQTFLFISIALGVMAMGIIEPVLPGLLASMQDHDPARTATIFGLCAVIWELLQFLLSPLFGVLSDRYGRRPVIMLANFGVAIDYLFMALTPTLGWLILGRVISGVTSAGVSTIGAYIADVTPPEKRAASFGMMGAAIGVGSVLGPAFGGLLGGISPRMPFYAAAGLGILNAIYGLFVMPESLPPERRTAVEWKRANPVGALALLRSSPELFGLSIVQLLHNLAHFALPSVFVLYVSYRYGWNERTIGMSLATVAVFTLIIQGGLLRPLVERLGERRILILGLCFGMVGFTLSAWAPNGIAMACCLPLLALWGVVKPSTQSLMTSRVGESEQGQLQGASGSVAGIAGSVGPGLFTQVFAVGISAGLNPGIPFLLSTLLLGLALVITLRTLGSREPVPAPPPLAGA